MNTSSPQNTSSPTWAQRCRDFGQIFALRPDEGAHVATLLALIVALQGLMVGKFFHLLSHPSEAGWVQFTRNFRMSGYDPYLYQIVHQWQNSYDVVRHPLLALLLSPLWAMNKLATMLTGDDCSVPLVALLLTFCASYACIFLQRTLRFGAGISRGRAWLLTYFFLAFGHIITATVVADHFCLSLFCIMLTAYLSARHITAGTPMGWKEGAALMAVTSGVTLTNGAVVAIAALAVNGRGCLRRGFLLRGIIVPGVVVVALAVGQKALLTATPIDTAQIVEQQTKWTRDDISRTAVLVENFFGESLQLHRRHVLGDVLSGRPVLVAYTWPAQYVVEAIVVALLAVGMWLGRRRRLQWIAAGVLAFNLLMHIGVGFALDEVHIMACHWAFAVPVGVAWIYACGQNRLALRMVDVVLAAFTLYLWAYHGMLLLRYLSWPLVK